MLAHWPMEAGKASISLKLQSSSSRDVRLEQRETREGRFKSCGVIIITLINASYCDNTITVKKTFTTTLMHLKSLMGNNLK